MKQSSVGFSDESTPPWKHTKTQKTFKLEYGESLVFNTSFISPEEKHTQVFAEEVIWQGVLVLTLVL